MAWVAVDKEGTEKIGVNLTREDYEWVDLFEVSEGEYYLELELPKGSIEKLIGRKLTWEDEPVELKGIR